MFQPREDKRKYKSISSTEMGNPGDWLAFANVVFTLDLYNLYNYKIVSEKYQSPYYYLRSDVKDYSVIKYISAEDVKPDPDQILKNIYLPTYNFMGGLPGKLIERLDEIITIGDMPARGSFGVSSWLKKGGEIHEEDRMITFWMSYLKSWIPVVVVDEETMSKHDDNYCDPNEHEGNQGKNEILGLYLSKSELFAGPCIAICLERIKKNAEELNITFEDLCIIVLLHEMAHAIMDPTNDLKCISIKNFQSAYTFGKKEEVELEIFTKNSLLTRKGHFAMEESLANMIMLRYCELQEDSNLLEVAKKFVGHQSRSYRFGLKQFEAADGKIDWSKWRDAKSGKLGLDPHKLKDWNYKFVVYEDPTYSVSDYNDIFKENTEEENSKEE